MPERLQQAINQRVGGSPRAPQPPRGLLNQTGSFKGVVTWNAPLDDRGIVGYKVYVDNETSPFLQTGPNSRRIEIPLTSNANRFIAISSVNELGFESPKIPLIASSNADQYNGGSGGSSPAPPPDWPSEPTGGRSGGRIKLPL